MPQDTKIGGPNSQFPVTRLSAILAARTDDPGERRRAFNLIVAAYWKPVYKTIRIKWHKSNEDAKDLTQGFFARAIEKDFFKTFDPSKARFRTFLRTCLDGYVANETKAAKRLKRGGNKQFLSLDFDHAESELQFSSIRDEQSLEDYFDKEWVRSLFSLAVDSLRDTLSTDGKSTYFEIFCSYDLEEKLSANKVTYDDLAQQFELPVTKVTNYLAHARREFRRILLEKLRELTTTDEEFVHEARGLLGVDPK